MSTKLGIFLKHDATDKLHPLGSTVAISQYISNRTIILWTSTPADTLDRVDSLAESWATWRCSECESSENTGPTLQYHTISVSVYNHCSSLYTSIAYLIRKTVLLPLVGQLRQIRPNSNNYFTTAFSCKLCKCHLTSNLLPHYLAIFLTFNCRQCQLKYVTRDDNFVSVWQTEKYFYLTHWLLAWLFFWVLLISYDKSWNILCHHLLNIWHSSEKCVIVITILPTSCSTAAPAATDPVGNHLQEVCNPDSKHQTAFGICRSCRHWQPISTLPPLSSYVYITTIWHMVNTHSLHTMNKYNFYHNLYHTYQKLSSTM